MTSQTLTAQLGALKAAGTVTDADLIALRKTVYQDGKISLYEADMLFGLNDGDVPMPQGWDEFFIGAMTDFLLRQTLPENQINDATALWLIERISQDGLVETSSEMAMLMNVLKKAERVSATLEKFALRQVQTAVLEGTGVLGRSRELKPGVIGTAEVEMLRTILYACGGDGGVGIKQAEAEVIFDLNDATSEQENDESWTRLFVSAVANYLMVMAAPHRASFEEAVSRDKWLSSNEGMSFNLVKAFKAWLSQSNDEAPTYSILNQAGVSEAERVTQEEASWVISRINRDGKLHKNEVALLQFLREECPDLHESLQPLIRAAA